MWVATAYALTFGGLLLLGGRAADLLGRRRVLMAGLDVFAAASLACALATADGFLIGARAVQGLGAADRGGLASGPLNMPQNLGGAIGIAIASSIAANHTTALLHVGHTGPAAPEAALAPAN